MCTQRVHGLGLFFVFITKSSVFQHIKDFQGDHKNESKSTHL